MPFIPLHPFHFCALPVLFAICLPFTPACWGDKSPNAPMSKGLAAEFRSRKTVHVASEMQDTGHPFPNSERSKIKDWLAGTIIPVLFPAE